MINVMSRVALLGILRYAFSTGCRKTVFSRSGLARRGSLK
jgi:hypothetical protein